MRELSIEEIGHVSGGNSCDLAVGLGVAATATKMLGTIAGFIPAPQAKLVQIGAHVATGLLAAGATAAGAHCALSNNA